MIGSSEFTEANNGAVIDRNSLGQHEEWGVGEVISVDAELVAAEKWKEMLEATQTDYLERSLVVSSSGKDRKLITSKIFIGDRNSSGPGLFPQGWRSAFQVAKDIVHVHTHPKPPELDHIQTTAFSDKDINWFMDDEESKASVMIDTGGVHMLARKSNRFSLNKRSENIKIEEDALKKTKAGGNTSTDLIHEIALRLAPFGIRYYYSPDITPSPEGFIKVKDVITL